MSDDDDNGTLDFNWLLPGHGRMIRFSDTQQRQRMLAEAVEDLRLALNLEDEDEDEGVRVTAVVEGMKKVKWADLLRHSH